MSLPRKPLETSAIAVCLKGKVKTSTAVVEHPMVDTMKQQRRADGETGLRNGYCGECHEMYERGRERRGTREGVICANVGVIDALRGYVFACVNGDSCGD